MIWLHVAVMVLGMTLLVRTLWAYIQEPRWWLLYCAAFELAVTVHSFVKFMFLLMPLPR